MGGNILTSKNNNSVSFVNQGTLKATDQNIIKNAQYTHEYKQVGITYNPTKSTPIVNFK